MRGTTRLDRLEKAIAARRPALTGFEQMTDAELDRLLFEDFDDHDLIALIRTRHSDLARLWDTAPGKEGKHAND